jgi:hypothetical protein
MASLRLIKSVVAFCVTATLLVACITGDQVAQLRPGMSKDDVLAKMGNPDGFRRANNTEALIYANRLMSGWSWDRADYVVLLEDGRVTQYGPGTVRQNSPNVGTLLFVPIR